MMPHARLVSTFLLACAAIATAVAPVHDHATGEDARLRAHFARVDRALRAADTAGLTSAQRRARAHHLRVLRAYARAGAFPRHRGEAVGPTPIFVDRGGNRCAMAHLIERSGHSALVARIARTANLAYLRDLSGDPSLVAWLGSAGLSLEEAAAIQPTYRSPPEPEDVPADGVMTSGVVVAGALGFPAIILNFQERASWEMRQSHALFGGLTSASLVSLGVADWAHDGELRGAGYFTLTVGVLAGAASLMNLRRGPGEDRGEPRLVGLGPRRGPDGESQLAMRMRF